MEKKKKKKRRHCDKDTNRKTDKQTSRPTDKQTNKVLRNLKLHDPEIFSFHKICDNEIT